MEPDPKCKWCNGSGEILLLVRVVPCDCTQPTNDAKEDKEIVVEKLLDFDGL